eukprot:5039818-Prymnesium_polylepis.1
MHGRRNTLETTSDSSPDSFVHQPIDSLNYEATPRKKRVAREATAVADAPLASGCASVPAFAAFAEAFTEGSW